MFKCPARLEAIKAVAPFYCYRVSLLICLKKMLYLSEAYVKKYSYRYLYSLVRTDKLDS